MKHTPGPWKVTNFTDGCNIYSEHHGGIAQIMHHNKHREEHETNAKLIAAAPEMLDNDKTNLATCQSLILELKLGRIEYAIETLQRMIVDTEAAIKKATT